MTADRLAQVPNLALVISVLTERRYRRATE